MKRRLNYTDRRHLTSHDVAIHIERPESGTTPARFNATISIPGEWKLNPHAKVYVEAYVVSTSMRFDFGTVAQITPPANTELTEIDQGSPLFRVKVVDESAEIGLLLAAAVEVRPANDYEESDGARSFFPLVMKDLGNSIWKVEMSRNDRPVLQLNNRISSLREEILSNSILQGAILPAALRIVLEELLQSSEYFESDWLGDWRTFVEELGGEPWPDDDDQLDDDAVKLIVDSAVDRFEEAKKFVINGKNQLMGGGHE